MELCQIGARRPTDIVEASGSVDVCAGRGQCTNRSGANNTVRPVRVRCSREVVDFGDVRPRHTANRCEASANDQVGALHAQGIDVSVNIVCPFCHRLAGIIIQLGQVTSGNPVDFRKSSANIDIRALHNDTLNPSVCVCDPRGIQCARSGNASQITARLSVYDVEEPTNQDTAVALPSHGINTPAIFQCTFQWAHRLPM